MEFFKRMLPWIGTNVVTAVLFVMQFLAILVVLGLYQRYTINIVQDKIESAFNEHEIVKEVVLEAEPEETVIYKEGRRNTDKYTEMTLNVEYIPQLPELPTGCEIVSLTMVLQYHGFAVDKMSLADDFLPKGEIGATHPNEAFVGNPRDVQSYGVWVPALVKACNSYLATVDNSENVQAYDMSNVTLSNLCKYVVDGYPVIIWGTENMQESVPGTQWEINGQTFQWIKGNHCLVLIGFNEESYIFADPLRGIVEYEKTVTEKRYKELGCQAMVVY